MKTLGILKSGILVTALAVASVGCSRDHIEAINLANSGDRSLKTNVEGAIHKYEEATRLDPTNHRILWKLARAYQKKEDWSNMSSTLARAVQAAPDNADYYYRRGFALSKIAADGNPDAYEEAKEPLKKCIEKDPNHAECYHELGEAFMWTGDDQLAIENFTKAIEHDPSVAYFYPRLAELYIALQFYDQAGQVLKEGTSLVARIEDNANSLYGMYTLLSNVHQAKNEEAARVTALEKAQEVGGKTHPEIAYNLGSTYAKMTPPKKEKALRLLKSFDKRNCGAKQKKNAEKYRDQCVTAKALLQKLSQ